MIGIVDYGAGNLKSVANALEHLGLPHRACTKPGDLEGVARIILPGVGQFGAAVRHLDEAGLKQELIQTCMAGTPTLGICLGMQLLLGASAESPRDSGLGILPGRVVRLKARRVPHMGWNKVTATEGSPLMAAGAEEYFYFAHSYVVESADSIAQTNADDVTFPSIIGRGRIWGTQFHPEKSGEQGLAMLLRFAKC